MARINPLALGFLSRHPADSARILEALPLETVCSLIRSIKPELAADIIECMITSYGTKCLHLIDKQTALPLIKEMNMQHAARLLRAMSLENSKDLIDSLPVHVKNNIHSALRYPDQTVGRIMDSNPFSLPESVTINDALKRIKDLHEQTVQEIFTVDDDHRLKGAIHISSLLSASKSSSLSTITTDVPYLTTRTTLNSAALHVGWQTFSALPVVGKDHILSGVMKSSALMHVLAETRGSAGSTDVLNEIFSMSSIYWIVMTEFLDAVTGGITEGRKRED